MARLTYNGVFHTLSVVRGVEVRRDLEMVYLPSYKEM